MCINVFCLFMYYSLCQVAPFFCFLLSVECNCVLYCIHKRKRHCFFLSRMTYYNDLLTNICSQVSLTDPDSCQKDFTQLSYDYEIRHHRPLRLKKKIYEFYTAPITKFWADSVCWCSLSIVDVASV